MHHLLLINLDAPCTSVTLPSAAKSVDATQEESVLSLRMQICDFHIWNLVVVFPLAIKQDIVSKSVGILAEEIARSCSAENIFWSFEIKRKVLHQFYYFEPLKFVQSSVFIRLQVNWMKTIGYRNRWDSSTDVGTSWDPLGFKRKNTAQLLGREKNQSYASYNLTTTRIESHLYTVLKIY